MFLYDARYQTSIITAIDICHGGTETCTPYPGTLKYPKVVLNLVHLQAGTVPSVPTVPKMAEEVSQCSEFSADSPMETAGVYFYFKVLNLDLSRFRIKFRILQFESLLNLGSTIDTKFTLVDLDLTWYLVATSRFGPKVANNSC